MAYDDGNLDNVLSRAGKLWAAGLAAQAARTPLDAAIAAGARSDLEIEAWIQTWRPQADETTQLLPPRPPAQAP
jgi:hypothetical protein